MAALLAENRALRAAMEAMRSAASATPATPDRATVNPLSLSLSLPTATPAAAAALGLRPSSAVSAIGDSDAIVLVASTPSSSSSAAAAAPAADSAARQAALLKSARSSFRWTAPASEDAAVHLAAVDVNPANSSRRLRGLEVAPSVYVPLRSRSSSRALKRKPSKRWDDDEELPPMPPDEFFDD